MRVIGYRLGVIGLTFLLISFFFAAVPAFAQIQIVPDGGCYEQGDYSIGYFLDLAQNILMFVLGISGAFALLMFVWGGFLMLSSAGEDKRVTQGREVLIQATTGLIIVLGSWTIVNYTVAALTSGTITASPAQIFGKNWSDLGSRECLSQYWKDTFKTASTPSTATTAATTAAGTATAAAGGTTATAAATTPPPASAVNMDEEGSCCKHDTTTHGEITCIVGGYDFANFFELNPPSPLTNATVKIPGKKRRDCLSRNETFTPTVTGACHLWSRVSTGVLNGVNADRLQVKQLFCGQQDCAIKPGNLLSCQ